MNVLSVASGREPRNPYSCWNAVAVGKSGKSAARPAGVEQLLQEELLKEILILLFTSVKDKMP